MIQNVELRKQGGRDLYSRSAVSAVNSHGTWLDSYQTWAGRLAKMRQQMAYLEAGKSSKSVAQNTALIQNSASN